MDTLINGVSITKEPDRNKPQTHSQQAQTSTQPGVGGGEAKARERKSQLDALSPQTCKKQVKQKARYAKLSSKH